MMPNNIKEIMNVKETMDGEKSHDFWLLFLKVKPLITIDINQRMNNKLIKPNITLNGRNAKKTKYHSPAIMKNQFAEPSNMKLSLIDRS